MSKSIKFTNTNGFQDLEKPQPASVFIPDWYKNIESYVGGKKITNGNGLTTATIKKCIPVFDAITAGYIITSPADVMVSLKDGAQYFEWANFNLISFHPIEQAPEHPARKPYQYPKWNNPWAIKTPKGYSTLFVQPMHRESVFTILPGIVDTDIYTAPVNFPFVINDPNFEGLIPKGTPIAQIIPIKRDAWKIEFGGQEELIEQNNITTKLQIKFFDRYKNMFWHRKEYK
jgi:hypothetical protein